MSRSAPIVSVVFAIAILAFGCAHAPPPPSNDTILVGTAMRTINPPLGAPLVGYPRPRPNTGVALDLCARAAVFGTPGKSEPQAALVVLDLIHIDLELGRAIRQRASAAVPGLLASSIMVSATHTHSGPPVARLVPGDTDTGSDPIYLDRLVGAASDAVVAAWSAREEVRVRVGHGSIRLGHNRRVVDSSGHATNEWRDPQGLHTGLFNPDIPVVSFEDPKTGAARALLISYACHPVVGGPGNTRVSADYPGHAVRALEAATQTKTDLFITGAAANINPRDALFPEAERAKPMGDAIAAEALAALAGSRPIKPTPIAILSEPLALSVRPEADRRYIQRLKDSPEGPRLTTEVQVLRLGDLAFISAPGELVAELGLAVQNGSPFRQTLIVYNANDHLGYLVTDAIRREGGYEADSAVSLDFERPYLAAARAALARAAAIGK